MKPAPPVMTRVATLRKPPKTRRPANENRTLRSQRARRSDRRPFGVLERKPQLFRELVDTAPRALPGALRLEPQIPDAPTPRCDHAANRAEIGSIGVLLVEAADDVGRDADERAQRSRRADAVLAAIPGAAEDERDLLEVVHEELLRLFVDVARPPVREHPIVAEQLLQLLRERRLRDAAAADTEQLDLIVERRILAVVQRAHDVVTGGERLVPIELPSGEADKVGGVQPGVLRVDRHEHLDHVIFRQSVEDDRRNGELLVAEAIDVGVQREETVLAVDGAQYALPFRHLQDPHTLVAIGRLKG